jgi:hypothetical protein
MPVNRKPNGTTVQCFIGAMNNFVIANIPAAYF